MGVCMKDHPSEDVLEKIQEVKEHLDEPTVSGLVQGLAQQRWSQPELNELFHTLKKLEKGTGDKTDTIRSIKRFIGL